MRSLGHTVYFVAREAPSQGSGRGRHSCLACPPGDAWTALNALLFLDRAVLKQPWPQLEDLARAKRPRRVPTVVSRGAVQAILAGCSGFSHVMGSLLYGAGLRLMEGVRLRVKDVDFTYPQITVRDGNGAQDRVTMLPRALVEPLPR